MWPRKTGVMNDVSLVQTMTTYASPPIASVTAVQDCMIRIKKAPIGARSKAGAVARSLTIVTIAPLYVTNLSIVTHINAAMPIEDATSSLIRTPHQQSRMSALSSALKPKSVHLQVSGDQKVGAKLCK
jgi:hypothetical protein